MTAGVIDGLKKVDVHQYQRKGRLTLAANGEYAIKRTTVEQVGQRVVFCLVADNLLGFPVFFKRRIADFSQELQLQRAFNGHGFTAVYAGNVVYQGLYHQLVHHKAIDKQEDNQQRQPQAEAVQQGLHIFGGVVPAKADAQRRAHGKVRRAHRHQGVARLALIAGGAAGNINVPPAQIFNKGLAVDTVGGKVQHLRHGIRRGVQGDGCLLGQLFQPGAQLGVQGADMRIAVAQVFGSLCRSKAKANDIRGILGAGAQAALLMAAQVGRAKRLAHAVPDEQSADSLGGIHFMAGYRESIHVLPLFQVNGDAQPCLHGVHMHRTAAVFGLDGCGKSGKAPYEATMSKVFMCDDAYTGSIIAINLDVTNNTGDYISAYTPVYEMTASLDGANLETAFLLSDNPEAIDNSQMIAAGETGQAQAAYLLPDGVTEGTLSVLVVALSTDGKSQITVLEQDIDLSTVEKVVSEAVYDVTLDDKKLTDDEDGNPLLVLDLTFTNNSSKATSFGSAVEMQMFQNGVGLTSAYLPYRHPMYDEEMYGSDYTDIQPGNSIAIRRVYGLNDLDSDVELSCIDFDSFDQKKILEETIDLSGVEAVVAESAYEFSMDEILIGYSDYNDDYVVVMVGEFTNNSDEDISFSTALDITARQSGMEMQSTYVPGASSYNSNNISPGTTIMVALAWELNSSEDDVSITVIDRYSYNKMTVFEETYTIDELLDNTLNYMDADEFTDEAIDESEFESL